MGKRATAPCSFPPGYQDSKRDIAPAACPSKAFAPSSYNPAWRADLWPPKACTRTEKMLRGTTVASRQIASSSASWNVKKSIISTDSKSEVSSRSRQPYLGFQRCLNSSLSKREARENAVAYNQSRSERIDGADDGGGGRAVDTLWRPRGLAPSAWPTACSTALYDLVSRYQLTEDQLKENGYPFPHPERSGAAILFTNHQKLPEDPWLRVCCRCGTGYPVLPSGHSIQDEECRFHWGRLLPAQAACGWETRYLCCSAPVGSAGCQVAKRHVQDGRKENLRGFVKTKEKVRSHPAQPGIYAVDCEMSYTTLGLELTRVTVVDAYMRIVFDTFVKPDNEIVDYNTKFSGVTEADLARTNVTLRDVQAVLLSLFSADTILVGHSLESDLLALKLVHRTVVDTSVLFPHRLGLRFKRSLRDLTASYLHKTIQNDERGHDSCEDARSCLNLIYWKIQEDAENNEDSGL